MYHQTSRRRDVVLGVGSLAANLVEIVLRGTDRWPAATVGALAVAGAVGLRRRRALTAAALFAAGYGLQATAGLANQAVGAAAWAVVAYHTAFAAEDLARLMAGGMLSLLPIAIFALASPHQAAGDFAPVDVLLLGAVWAAGRAVRHRQLRTVELEAQVRLAEREREALARAAVARERTRIARELHDVVAHGVSLIVVQAQAADTLLDHAPERARTAIAAIEEAGREALVELRRLLGVLRDEDGATALAPQPSLARLQGLLAQVGAAGVPVELVVEGRTRPLPPGIDLSAYRIVQEALTNVVKHGSPARARVFLRYSEDSLDIEVADDGCAHQAGESGHGLIGMRERAAVFDGELEVLTPPSGGFVVRARLQLDGH